MSRIIKETTVYGGPRTSGYATMATLHQNQSVTAIFKELDFLFVEYDGVNRTKRRGRNWIISSTTTRWRMLN